MPYSEKEKAESNAWIESEIKRLGLKVGYVKTKKKENRFFKR